MILMEILTDVNVGLKLFIYIRGIHLSDVQSLDAGEDSQDRRKNFDEIYEKAVW